MKRRTMVLLLFLSLMIYICVNEKSIAQEDNYFNSINGNVNNITSYKINPSTSPLPLFLLACGLMIFGQATRKRE